MERPEQCPRGHRITWVVDVVGRCGECPNPLWLCVRGFLVRSHDSILVRVLAQYEMLRAQTATAGAPAPTRRPLTSHCRNGHPRTVENTYTSPKGLRTCRVCRRVGIWGDRTAGVA